MSKFFKKLFGTLSDKPWEKGQMETDNSVSYTHLTLPTTPYV